MCLCWFLLNICLIFLRSVQADSFVRWVEEVYLWSNVLECWVYWKVPFSATAGLFWNTNPVNDPISTWFGNLSWSWWSALYLLILVCRSLFFFCCILLLWYLDTMPHLFFSLPRVCEDVMGRLRRVEKKGTHVGMESVNWYVNTAGPRVTSKICSYGTT